MRPLLALLLVAAAATAFFLALNASSEVPDPGAVGQRPAEVVPSDPDTMTSLAPGSSSPSGNAREAAKQDDPQRTVHPDAALGNALRGRVVRSGGAGVEGAQVVLTRYGPTDLLAPVGNERVPDRETETDAEGYFEFTDVQPGEDHTVIAAHRDFGRRTEPFLSVADGEIGEVVLVELQPGSTVRGRVTDVHGGFLDGALVRLSPITVGFLEEGAGVLSTTSDDRGIYEFRNVSQGHYTLTVTKEGFGKTQLQRLEVSGDDEELVHDVALEVAHLIAGRVVSAEDGLPIFDAKVEAFSTDRRKESTNTVTRSNEDGQFELNDVRAGSYTLLVKADSFKVERLNRVETGEIALEVELPPLPKVSGFVYAPDGSPLRNFTVRLRQEVPNSKQTMPVMDTDKKVTESKDGSFVLSSPRVGQFMAEATHPRYAASFSEPFQLEEGGEAQGVIIRMTDGGTISGRVVDPSGDPISGALVKTHHTEYVNDPFWRSLGDAYPSAAARKQIRTDADGWYQLTGLTAEVYQLSMDHPDHAPLTIRGIEVEDDREVKVDRTTLTPGASVSGTVYGPSGAGLAGAVVQITLDAQASRSDYGAFYKTRSNSQGRYTFTHLPPGHYKISVSRQGAADNPFVGMTDEKATRKPLTLVDGQDHSRDFTLSN